MQRDTPPYIERHDGENEIKVQRELRGQSRTRNAKHWNPATSTAI